MFNTTLKKVLNQPEYKAFKHDCKMLLKQFPETAQKDIIERAYSNTTDIFRGDKGDRLIEFWNAIYTNIRIARSLYLEGII